MLAAGAICGTFRGAIRDRRARIVLFGGKDDVTLCASIRQQVIAALPAEKCNVIDTSGMLSLAEVAGAMQLCSCIVANDSALMHVAASQHKPLVAIFGSTVKEFGFAPTATNVRIVENLLLACRPCTHIGRDSCPKGHFQCMKEIEADEILCAISTLI